MKPKETTETKRKMRICIVIAILIDLFFVPLLADNYVKVTNDKIVINKFLGFGETSYTFDKVKEVDFVKSRKTNDGKISRKKYYEVAFNDNYVFTMEDDNYNTNVVKQTEMMKFIAGKSGKEIKIIDPYPKK